MPNETVTRVLMENQIDCDIVPQDIFEESDVYHTVMADGKLKVNTQEYSVVAIPCLQFVTESFAKGIKELLAAGVRVYFVGGRPEAVLSENISLEDLSLVKDIAVDKLVEIVSDVSDIKIEPANSYIRYYHYIKDDIDLYMLVNEGDKEYTGNIEITGKYAGVSGKKLFSCDSWNNRIYDISLADGKGTITLVPGKSRIIIIPKDAADEKALADVATCETVIPSVAQAVEVAVPWKRSIVKSVNYPNFEAAAEVTLPDDYSKVDREFSGWFKYENSFTAEDTGNYYLEITDAFEVVTLYINDKKVSTQIFAPFVFDISDFVVAGANNIRIEIATTLEREMLSQPDMFGRPKTEPAFGSGILGDVNIYKG